MILRIATIVVKELLQFRRDRLLLLFITLVPVLQLVLMAQAVTRGIDEQGVVVMDLDHSRWSRQLAVKLDTAEELEVRYYATDDDEVSRLMDEGRVRLAVVIPSGFSKNLLSRREASIQVIVDGANAVPTDGTNVAPCIDSPALNAHRFLVDLPELGDRELANLGGGRLIDFPDRVD